ncbi:MAG: hypothetical protein HN704_06965 [Bacteroidetes bacterium]|nr:hypothetical protein [Bacteroidota bacterium]MBT6686049.1 hypothetical protein [Bacteroidota bacterium]MBT7491328.1 hypothetical protein [Bacteroidota bacterium]
MNFRKLFLPTLLISIVISCDTDKNNCPENQEILSKTIETISNDFQRISIDIEKAAVFAGNLYSSQNKITSIDTNIFTLSSEGTIYKNIDDGASAIFVTGHVPVNQTIFKNINISEPLDSLFKVIISKHNQIVQLFYYDKNSILRLYPFFDTQFQFKAKLDITQFGFYSRANEKNNPKKKVIFINEPYADPAGRGFLISVVAPVYDKEKFMGVLGANITINTIVEEYFDENTQKVLVLNDSGTIITASNYVYNVISIPLPEKYQYYKNVSNHNYLRKINSLSKHKNVEFRNFIKQIIRKENEQIEIEINEYNFCLNPIEIEKLGWIIIEFNKI